MTASPDDRSTTSTLRLIADEIGRRSDARVEVWFLRASPEDDVWPGARVIDDLRTWPVASIPERVGVPFLPDVLRGRRLRGWTRRLDPDIIVLDDGLGERLFRQDVLEPGRGPVVVARLNEEPPRHDTWEPIPVVRPEIALCAPGASTVAPVGARVMDAAHLRRYPEAGSLGDAETRARTRAVLGVPSDVPLVVGWGDDGWLDGADVFVRALWALEAHHGVQAHGLWLGLGADGHEIERLHAEAVRCGLGGRFHQRSGDTPAARCCGDAAFLPYRDPGDPFDGMVLDLLSAIVTGLGVVTFTPTGIRDPMIVEVRPLDVDAAADALAGLLAADHDEAAAMAWGRHDVVGWVDRLFSLADELR